MKSSSGSIVVSILVLLEFALQVTTPREAAFFKEVSILVLLEFALQVRHDNYCSVFICVSILVLLEFALQEKSLCSSVGIAECFNPCFIGICSSSVGEDDYKIRVSGFNPCFIGICSSRHLQKV